MWIPTSITLLLLARDLSGTYHGHLTKNLVIVVPAKAGTQRPRSRSGCRWALAFAGTTITCGGYGRFETGAKLATARDTPPPPPPRSARETWDDRRCSA